jgi:hypothetical protein
VTRPRGAAHPPATMRRIAFLISLVVLCALATPVAGLAASSDSVLRDCVDGQIDGSYTTSELQQARKKIPSDIDEYSDCRGAIDAARTDNAGSGGPSGASGGGASPGGGASGGGAAGSGGASVGTDATTAPADPQTPAEQAAVKAATEGGGDPVRVGPGETVAPGATGLPTNAALRRSVPDPLLVVLILLGTVALVGGVLGTRARVVTRRLGRT